ncbi:MAG: response regulator [Bacteroidetes bacterium]|nr:response regulator [Bacteroidota bacterium]
MSESNRAGSERTDLLLIIDDDPLIRLVVRERLGSVGFEIAEADGGEQGIEEFARLRPDLVLLDVDMPDLNGFEVCRKLREEKFINPIIIITASNEQIDEVVGLEIGADDYIKKPFNLREVLARIRANLRRSERLSSSTDDDTESLGDQRIIRNLQCVMFTDIKDYSKKMHSDENSALLLLQNHNRIMKATIHQHRGNIIEIIGDAFLVSFNSAVKAVKCGAAIQNSFKKYNSSKKEKNKIELRIGIHLGDLIEIEGKLKGDTLNIAARIQQNAEPLRVYLSESVYLAVKGKTGFNFEMSGVNKFKNISEPITTYYIVDTENPEGE